MRNGPAKPHWGQANWFVNWTAKCDITINLEYYMPEHANLDALPADVKSKWISMTEALEKHELQHLEHGLNAVKFLHAAECRQGRAIVKHWARQDRKYDARTRHGYTEGVVFE